MVLKVGAPQEGADQVRSATADGRAGPRLGRGSNVVKRVINRLTEWWRGFISRHTFWGDQGDFDWSKGVDWDDVLNQAQDHHNMHVEVMAQLQKEQEEENVNETVHLRALFEARDDAHKQCTMIILETLQPTLIAAVLEFFELQSSEVVWMHVSINDNTLALIGTISETAKVKETETEKQVSDALSHVGVSAAPRYLRVGIPIEVVEGGTKQTILDYFKEVSDNEEARIKEAETQILTQMSEDTGFDVSELTEDQRARFLSSLYTMDDPDTKIQ